MDRQQVQQKSPQAISESADDDDLQLIDGKVAGRMAGHRETWLFEASRDGRFPKPLKIGRSRRWVLGEVRRWVRERIAERPPVK